MAVVISLYSYEMLKAAGDTSNEMLFLCLARNCERHLPLFFRLLDTLRAAGVGCRAIVGENGSSDQTRRVLSDASAHGVFLVDTIEMASAPHRLARMAIGRQLLLDAVKTSADQPQFLCVSDLDNVMEQPPSSESMQNAMARLARDMSIFGISATSRPVYYDLLALRAPGYDFSNLDAEIATAKKQPLTYYQFHQKRIYSNQKSFTSGETVVCDSTFNGLCLYRTVDYLKGTYRDARESEVCEHVTLNLSIARATGKKMLIAPDIIVQTPADHAPVGFSRFWKDRLRDAFRR